MTVDELISKLETSPRDIDDYLESLPNNAAVLKVYAQLRDEYDALDARAKAVKAILDGGKGTRGAVNIIAERFDDEGVKTLKIEEGTFTRKAILQPNIKDKEAFIRWLRETGQESIIKTEVSWQTAGAVMREELEKGNDTPPGLESFVKNQIQFTRPRKK